MIKWIYLSMWLNYGYTFKTTRNNAPVFINGDVLEVIKYFREVPVV